MALFNTGGAPMKRVRPKLTPLSGKPSAGTPLLARLAALENSRLGGNTGSATVSPNPVFQGNFKFPASADVNMSVPKTPPFKLKSFETSGYSVPSGSGSFPKVPTAKKPSFKATSDENKIMVSTASGKPPWIKSNTAEYTTTTPKSPSVPKPKTIPALQSKFEEGPSKEHPTETVSEKAPSTQKPKVVIETSGKRESDDPCAPKKKPLPALFALGNPPLKPNRPPNVNIQRFMENGTTLPSSQETPLVLLTSQGKETISSPQQQEESYDDVGVMKPSPPIPPGGHLNQQTEVELCDEEMYEDLDQKWTDADNKSKQTKKGKKEQTKPNTQQEPIDEEMYEDLEERWAVQDAKETSKDTGEIKGNGKKNEKEERRRLEQEKKLQKAKEKRDQEAKKKFKLSGTVQVIQRAKAQVDCKGGKSDLPLKQGETIEIVRIINNPEGRWLGRNDDGHYGYVKIESVDIDFDSLKQHKTGLQLNQPGGDPEIYDDVAAQDTNCSIPSQPLEAPPLKTAGEEIYDDVESPNLPPPPLPVLNTPKGTEEVIDAKKKKKFEKEEKEFRKKFKFEGDIQVLYDVTIVPTLITQKWGAKDLPLKPGEMIQVIIKPADGKLIGRNSEGKCGYVGMVNVVQDTGEIYDDVGEVCVYDND